MSELGINAGKEAPSMNGRVNPTIPTRAYLTPDQCQNAHQVNLLRRDYAHLTHNPSLALTGSAHVLVGGRTYQTITFKKFIRRANTSG